MREKKNKIKVKRTKPSTKIKATKAGNDELHFSFKYLDFSYEKFSVSNCQPNYFLKLFERFKNISTFTFLEFQNCHSPALRSHSIKWEQTSEPSGFNLNEQLKSCTAYQFEVSKSKYGRVHGFIIEPVFYVVWLDPDHNLYEVQK